MSAQRQDKMVRQSKIIREGEVISASTVVRATPLRVYDVVSDVERIPEWSPECRRVERISATEFRGFNRRRLGRWSSKARIVTADRGAEFGFVVTVGGGDFTQWTYRMAPHPEGCELTEEMAMCRDLPRWALVFEQLALGVRDRRTDLRGNLDASLRRLRTVIEGNGAPAGLPQDTTKTEEVQ